MPLSRRSVLVASTAATLAVLTGCTGASPRAAAALTPSASSPLPGAATAVTPSAVASAAPTTHRTATGRGLAAGLGTLTGAQAEPAVAAPTAKKPTHGGRLAGRTIVLDPGHNGGNAAQPHRLNALVPAGGFLKPCNTAGAETNGGYPEHAFNWDVVLRTEALLEAQGAKVVLTRHNDTGFGPCVNERAAIGNAAHADAVIAVHADGAASSDYGFHVIAPALAPNGGNRAILSRSWVLAQAVHAAFHTVTGEPFSTYVHEGLTRRTDLAGLNLSRVPAIFIECANMRNAADARRLTSAAWREKAAAGLVAGLDAYFGA